MDLASAAMSNRLMSILASWQDWLELRSRDSRWVSSLEWAAMAALDLQLPTVFGTELLPEVVLVPAAQLPGAAAAYAEPGLILLNADWFASASTASVLLRLTEELGHHLEVLFGLDDHPGDEGARFVELLVASQDEQPLSSRVLDQGVWWTDQQLLSTPVPVEQSALVRRRSLTILAPSRSSQEQRNQAAFAALKADGSVVAWGDPEAGGNLAAVADSLSGQQVAQIYSTVRAFAALTHQGSVLAWGDSARGGSIPLRLRDVLGADVISIASTEWAFAALTKNGSVVSWGDYRYGGFISEPLATQLNNGVEQIYANAYAFAALKQDGSVITWGGSTSGGDSSDVASQLAEGVAQIVPSRRAFAALKQDGSVVTWGFSGGGGNSSLAAPQLRSGVADLAATDEAFVALSDSGAVITWGNRNAGGQSTVVADAIAKDVVSITATQQAFAALKRDGSVVTWGGSTSGGDSTAVSRQLNGDVDVSRIVATQTAFAALRTDGSVVTWGAAGGGGDSSAVSSQLEDGVFSLAATDAAFAALKADGSVVTWGAAGGGGDSSAVATALRDVNELVTTASAFAARRADGSVVTWGAANAGGDSSGVQALLAADVVGFADPFHDDVLGADAAEPLLDLDGDGVLAPLEDGLFLAAAVSHQEDGLIHGLAGDAAAELRAAALREDQRLDIDASGVVDLVDVQILLRFGFGTFPGEALTDGLVVNRPLVEVWQHLHELQMV